MKNIYYIAELDFEKPNASTARVINNVKALQMNADVYVRIIGYGNTPKLTIEGIEIVNLPKGNSTPIKFLHYIFRSIDIVFGLKKLSVKPDTVIYYGTHSSYLCPLLYLRKKMRFTLLADVVEWYDYKSAPMGRFILFVMDVHLAMTKLIPQCDGIITISSFLKDYYQRSHDHKKVIQIPVTVDTRQTIEREDKVVEFSDTYLNLIYAGVPGKKDILVNAIEAVNQLCEEKYKIRFYILGCDRKDIGENYKQLISENIIFLGRIKQDKVSSYLSQADFSILLRPDKRFAHAGFSTKFVESLNAGLPVIANLTGDIGNYLVNGKNGYILSGIEKDTIAILLRQLATIPKKDFQTMKINAKKTAENFDYRNYSKIINNFIV